MKRKKTVGYVQAYMTLEASFIMGWVIFILAFLIYLSFYSYNRCILFEDAYAIAFRTAQKPLSKEQKLKYAQARIDEQFGNKYIAAKHMEKAISIKGDRVIVDASLDVMPPTSLHSEFLPVGGWTLACLVEADIQNPTEIIRNFRKAESLLGHQ